MNTFLQHFGELVAGILQGFDRLVFKGRLTDLYWAQGMNNFLWSNRVLRKDFKAYASEVTGEVLKASLVAQAKELGRYRYLKSAKTDKEQVAREMAAEHNSLKLYNHYNVLRPEMTINNPQKIRVYRRSASSPRGPLSWRPLRASVVDIPLRAEVGQAANERYLEALSATAATRTVKELAEPLTRRVPEAGAHPRRKVRAMNPLAADDAGLLTALSDPKWMLQGLRNRDLVAALYGSEAKPQKEKRRQSAHVTRLLRLLRAHGLIEKIKQTHRYQISAEARTKIQALLAVRNANPDELTSKAA